jgi:hypothetical protein
MPASITTLSVEDLLVEGSSESVLRQIRALRACVRPAPDPPAAYRRLLTGRHIVVIYVQPDLEALIDLEVSVATDDYYVIGQARLQVQLDYRVEKLCLPLTRDMRA